MDDHNQQQASTERQIVMFELCGELYGIGLEIVEEVIRVADISTVPQTQGFVEGVINLRGYVIPVVDLGRRFGVGAVERTRAARIMVVGVEDQVIGVVVDRVLEVLTIRDEDIEPPSELLRSTIRVDYLIGFAEVGQVLVKLLDFDKVFSLKEISALAEMQQHEHGLPSPSSEEGDPA